jgi:hypothetical protein
VYSQEILEMDKLTLISGTLFMAADVFAIVSLAMPDWIITDVGGNTEYLDHNNLYIHFNVCTAYLVQFIIQSNKCTTYKYIM